MKKTSNEPKDFGEALALKLREGHELNLAIRLAAKEYPEQFKAYENEILHRD